VPSWDQFAAEHGSFAEGLSYSDHGYQDAAAVVVNTLAARKILNDPQLLEHARATLEKWISRQTPAPSSLLEWRHILAGTPQQIAAVAMSLTEDGTRLRSSSPLPFVLTPIEREALSAFGRTLRFPEDLLRIYRPWNPDERRASPTSRAALIDRVEAALESRRRAQRARHAEILNIASRMKAQCLPDDFIARAVDLSQEFEGIFNLMRMWRDEPELSERDATLSTILDLVDDCAEVKVSKPLIGAGANAETLGAFLDDWEQTHGRFTNDELRAAESSMGAKSHASPSAGRTVKPKKFARILAQAITTFGSQEAAEAWLNSSVMSLGMKRPIDLLATIEGAQRVEDVLGRIDAGVAL